MSTIETYLGKYQFVAAAWERAERSISLAEWLTSESILVLGNDEQARTALDAINQVIFKRLSELILAQTESETRRTWIFLDELRQAGPLNGLSALLTKGRSKGTCVVLGFQDIEGLRDVYGTQVANEIAGQCANKAILRSDSAITAEWASALFGRSEVVELHQSVMHSVEKATQLSQDERYQKREVVLASEIMNLRPTNRVDGMQGFFITPHVGVYCAHRTGKEIGAELVPVNPAIPNLIPRDEADQYLTEYCEDVAPEPAALAVHSSAALALSWDDIEDPEQ